MSEEISGIEEASESRLLEQHEMFGLEIIEWSAADTSTAHLKSFALASDGMEYAIKRISDGTDSQIKVNYPMMIPASEWFCYKLAEKCGIATPTCRLLYDSENKEYVFGSRIEIAAEGSKTDQSSNMAKLLREGNPVLLKQLWAIYTFDQFVYNIDRHINNYLYTKGRFGVVVHAFDFSLAAFVFGWPSDATKVLPSNCNTQVNWSVIKQLTGTTADYRQSAEDVLKKLEKLTDVHVNQIIDEMPKEWLHPGLIQSLLTWWVSKEKIEKIELIRGEINND